MSSIRDFFPIDYKVGGTKHKKNFLLENKKYVAKLAKSTQISKDPSNKLSYPNTQKNKDKYEIKKVVTSDYSKKFDLDKIDSSIKSIRSAIAQTKISQEKLSIKNSEKMFFTFKDQATQTMDPYDEENLLKDSIIRYPKIKNSDKVKIIQKSNVKTTAVQTNSLNSKSIRQQNDKNLNTKLTTETKENLIDQHQPGEIPKYLKNRKILKEKNEKKLQKKLAIQHELGLDDPACPPGHVLLPEPERLDHLTKIKKDYSRLILQLNMLPLSSDSFKMKEKRKNLEKELDQLQLGIKLFSKEKLFVSVNPKLINYYK